MPNWIKTPVGTAKPRRAEKRSALRVRDVFALTGLTILIGIGGVLGLGYDEFWRLGFDPAGWIDDLGVWGPAAIIALMVLHCFIPFPAELIALCAGAVFGTLFGSALVWVGAMIGASLSFWLSRLLGRAAIERLLPTQHRRAFDEWADDHGAMTLLISRFIPVIAFNLINYAAGLTRISWWTFVWTTSIGIIPLTVLMAHLGAKMTEFSWPYLLVSSAGGIVAIWMFDQLRKKHGWLQFDPQRRAPPSKKNFK